MLTNSIFETLAFFDAQDLALTLGEIGNYLTSPNLAPCRGGEGEVAPSEIEKIIRSELSGKVEHRDGLFFLKGRGQLVEKRKQRYHISLLRFRKAKKYLKFLRHMPYVRAVALSGSQALLNSAADSDIDLLIITAPNRIWLARSLVSLYFQLTGQRRHGQHIANRFCLNHYLAEDHEITQDKNLYTAVEYASLLPVFGAEHLQKFWEKNQWIREYLPNAKLETNSSFFNFQPSRLQSIREAVLDYSGIGAALNLFLGWYQRRRIRRQDHILVSDSELSFHPASRGQRVLAEYKNRVSSAV